MYGRQCYGCLGLLLILHHCVQAEDEYTSPICTYGTFEGATTNADCNPACWPRWSSDHYCSNYNSGFGNGIRQLWGIANGCSKVSDTSACQCHPQATGDTTCWCGSSTMNKQYCYKSTVACNPMHCGKGRQFETGCGCEANGVCSGGAGCKDCGANEWNTEGSTSQCTAYLAVAPGFYVPAADMPTSDLSTHDHNIIATPCDPGTYSPGALTPALATHCTPCGIGTASNGGQASCPPCPHDHYCDTAGLAISTVQNINSGYACDATPMPPQNLIKLCQGGHGTGVNIVGSTSFVYYAQAGHRLIDPAGWRFDRCPKGTFTPVMRTAADPNTLTTCTNCTLGTYSVDMASGITSCTLCPQGTHQNVAGSSFCKPCPQGTASFFVGMVYCAACPLGTYRGANMMSDALEVTQDQIPEDIEKHFYCTNCVAGSYAAVAGATSCTLASSGSYVPYNRATAQQSCLYPGQTCMRWNTTTFASPTCTTCTGSRVYSQAVLVQCGWWETNKVVTTGSLVGHNVGQGATWIWDDNNSAMFCDYCPSGQYLDDTQTCRLCPSGSFCSGRGASPRQFTMWNSSWLGTFYMAANGNGTSDITRLPCLVCAYDEFMSQDCTQYQNRVCTVCDTCGIKPHSPFKDFTNYIKQPCGSHSDTVCGKCTPELLQIGAACNPCPNGTLLSNGTCHLCAAGSFCVSDSGSSSGRRLLGSVRWLLGMPQEQQQACPNGTVSGAGANTCQIDCGTGFFSEDAQSNNCGPNTSPSLKRVAWRVAGQDAVAAVQLRAPWVGYYALARNPSINNAVAPGELMLIGPANWAISLAGSPFATASVAPSVGGPPVLGSLVRLGRIYGMAADSSVATRLVMTEVVGGVSLLRVADLTMTANSVSAAMWSAGSAPVSSSKLMRIAPKRAIDQTGHFYVADMLANCVWSVILNDAPAQASFTLVSTPSFVLRNPTAVATAASSNIIYLAVLDMHQLMVCEIAAVAVNPVCIALWQCGGGILHTSSDSPPQSCSGFSVTSGLVVDIALVDKQRIYMLTTDARATADGSGQQDGVALVTANVSTATATLSWIMSLSSPEDFGQGVAFSTNADFILTSGPDYGASVQTMGLHGCLCAAGLYCMSGQCVMSPAGTYSDSWASAPTKCPPGSAGSVIGAKSMAEGCKLCSSDDHMTSYEWGSVTCMLKCSGSTPVYSATQNECVGACDVTLGLYREEVSAGSSCKPCPYGTHSTGGEGIGACSRCDEGSYYASKTCVACNGNTTTATKGADVCMPSTSDPINDGVSSSMSSSFSSGVMGLDATPSGVLFVALASNTVWRWPRQTRATAAAPAEFATLPANPANSRILLQATGDSRTLYSAASGDTCVRVSGSAVIATATAATAATATAATTTAYGDCGHAGALGNIVSLALMEQPNSNAMLMVASRIAWQDNTCHAVLSVALYNGQVRALMHYDATMLPAVTLSTCITDPITLASAPRGRLYVSYGALVSMYDVFTDSAVVTLVHYPAHTQAVSAMFATASGALILAERQQKTLDIMINAPDVSSMVSVMSNASSAIDNVAAAGNHVWYTMDGSLQERVVDMGACADGFTLQASGICMQMGVGTYGGHVQGVQLCPVGTYGAMAGAATLAEGCLPCPAATVATVPGSVGCSACTLGQVASADATQCLGQCGPASYLNTATVTCVACPAGYTTTLTLARQATDCVPCPAGSFIDSTTGGQCAACADGFTSLAGSHHCVIICDPNANTCAATGKTCASTSNLYTTLTQTQLQTAPIDVTVQRNGGVFYTDGASIYYYLDDCSQASSRCAKNGDTILSGGTIKIAALAISNAALATGGVTVRYLYYASADHTIQRKPVVYTNGIVDIAQTVTQPHVVVAGKSNIGGMKDGPCAGSLFNTITDMEVAQRNNGNTLYVLDAFNYRVRSVELSSGNGCVASTLLMNGQSTWNQAMGTVGTVLTGLGLSADELTIFLAVHDTHSVFSLVISSGSFTRLCQFSVRDYKNNQPTTTTAWCTAQPPVNDRPCMLRNVYDVVATAENNYVYAAFTQGITEINLHPTHSTMYFESWGVQCQQVAGVQNDVGMQLSTGSRDGQVISGSDLTTAMINSDATQLNYPYQLAYAADTDVIYIADLNNRAIRRMYVNSACTCAPGFTFLPDSRTCYNPSPNWNAQPLPACPPGFYALDGEATCAHSCAVAHTTTADTAAARACVQNLASVVGPPVYRFEQILDNTAPQTADWYGYPQYASTPTYDKIPQDTTMKYHVGDAAGRAPWGGEYATLTWSTYAGDWVVEYDWTLQPTLLAAGLWYPCADNQIQQECKCPTAIYEFESQSPDRPNLTPARWEYLRASAAAEAGVVLDGSSLHDISMGQGGVRVSMFSRFYMFGSDSSVAHMCGEASSGPCFTVMTHANTNDLPMNSNSAGYTVVATLTRKDVDNWTRAGCQAGSICNATCYVGWPAHYACPDGYMWVGPGAAASTDAPTGLTDQVACISCMPGFYSALDSETKKQGGGPYTCDACTPGSYSSAAGASVCQACTTGTYSSADGASACTVCNNPQWAPSAQTTLWPGAYLEEQCTGCEPGTGSCGSCLKGEYQSNAGQAACLPAPMGSYAPDPNATAAIACPEGTFTGQLGHTACTACHPHDHQYSHAGATACLTCHNAGCNLVVGNVCGQGCGLNMYWNGTGCVFCPSGTLNGDFPCAIDVSACLDSPRADMYLPPGGSLSVPVPCPRGTVASLDWTSCVPCITGSYADGGHIIRRSSATAAANSTCPKCPAGTFGNATGASKCFLCPPGTYGSATGATICSICPVASQCPVAGANASQACPKGSYGAVAGLITCTPCARNTIAADVGQSACDACQTNNDYYSPHPGGTICRLCNGTMDNNGTCNSCPLGNYFQASPTPHCQACSVGTVNLVNMWATDASACAPCPSPTAYAAATGDACIESHPGFMPNVMGTGQTPCGTGTYRGINMTACDLCPPGTYTNKEATITCEGCDAGYYTANAGVTICSQCDPWHYSGNGASGCLTCAAGTQVLQQASCAPCSPNMYGDGSGGCQACPDAKYAPSGASACSYCPIPLTAGVGTCIPCPAGTISSTFLSGGVYSQCQPIGTRNLICPNAGSTNSAANCSYCAPPRTTIDHITCTLCAAGKTRLRDSANTSQCTSCGIGTFSSDGQACTTCAAGYFTNSVGMSACQPCPAGTYRSQPPSVACLPCPVGTYANVTGLSACFVCKQGWAGKTGQQQCSIRNTVCLPGQFVNRTDDPVRDNSCAGCVPCSANEFIYSTAGASLALVATPSSLVQYTAASLCDGMGVAPGYLCLDPSDPNWLLGYRVAMGAAGSTQDDDGVADGNLFAQCPDMAAIAFLMAYTPHSACPTLIDCFVSCRYGLNPQAVSAYGNILKDDPDFTLTLAPDKPANNVFLMDNMIKMTATQVLTICSPHCNLGPCPVGYYRPQVQSAYPNHNMPACGAPCGIPGACPSNNEGCSAQCINLPANAVFTGGASGVDNNRGCTWFCNSGWHWNADRSACDACAQANVTAYCGSANFALKVGSDCTRTMTPSQVCVACTRIDNSALPTWNSSLNASGSSGCQYSCNIGYFFSASQKACLPCINATLAAGCSIGTYLDVSVCNTTHVPPTCSPCVTPSAQPALLQFLSNGALSPTGCMAVCNTWYHTYDASIAQTLDVAHYAIGVAASNIQCIPCTMYDGVVCGLQGCLKGHYRDLSVLENQTGACKMCILSVHCPTGYFAPPCTGNTTADASCQPCAPLDSNSHRIYVPNGVFENIVSNNAAGNCPSTCANNYVVVPSDVKRCVPCATHGCSMLEPAPGQPSECAYRFSIWNAPQAIPWWDVTTTPSQFMQYDMRSRQPLQNGQNWQAAGVCWPCPYGTDVEPGDTTLCLMMNGYARAGSLPITTISIPVLTSDMIAVFTHEPRPQVAGLSRRLLSLSLSQSKPRLGGELVAVATTQHLQSQQKQQQQKQQRQQQRKLLDTSNDAVVSPCPVGSFKPSRGESFCQLCPSGRSTASEGSFSIASCVCIPGHAPTPNSSVCTGCAADYFLSQQSCVPCPINQTTWGHTASSRCSCALGYYRIDGGGCAACPAGSYCVTCTEGETMCPSNGVNMFACFPGSTSPAGSSSVDQCSCTGSMALVTVMPGYYMCMSLPFGTRSIHGAIVCKDGWKTNTTTGSLACSLCWPGAFAASAAGANGEPTIPVVCALCPVGTFASSSVAVAVAGCTQCPAQQTTARAGATSADQCICPDGLIKSADGSCIGCTTRQYFNNATMQCDPCQPHSIAPSGATSAGQCQCQMGYAMVAGACSICPTGSFYISPSAACQPCPTGSTTAGPGARSLSACGATSGLCAAHYIHRNTGGCVAAIS